MRKLRILMIVLAIALTFPTLVLAIGPSAPSQQENGCWTYDYSDDCLLNLGCFFRATYRSYWKICCENGYCDPPTQHREFKHCGC
jgi:hypothetical protein